jgi:hypothetical protein
VDVFPCFSFFPPSLLLTPDHRFIAVRVARGGSRDFARFPFLILTFLFYAFVFAIYFVNNSGSAFVPSPFLLLTDQFFIYFYSG